MAKTALPPGFRFHPTDVELIMYYLKRKILRKKLHLDAVAEVNIYKFAPWDLPGKTALKSQDLEWFFFCPREKKYGRGARVKRTTEHGYWKSTGKDRPVSYNGKTVGTVGSLVFHLGSAPKGQRTDWVCHEYKILDEDLEAAGIQDSFVLCKVFQKNGPGPKNGAEYGAPFNESDWADDDVCEDQDIDIPSGSDVPFPAELVLTGNERSVGKSLFLPGNTSGLPLIENIPSPLIGPSTNEIVTNKTIDEVELLLANFEGGNTLFSNEKVIDQDDFKDIEMNADGNDYIYNVLTDLGGWASKDHSFVPDFSAAQEDNRRPPNYNMVLPDDGSFIELNDLQAPLNTTSDGFLGTEKSTVDDVFGSYDLCSEFEADNGF